MPRSFYIAGLFTPSYNILSSYFYVRLNLGEVSTVTIDRILIKFMTHAQLRQTEGSLRARPPGRSVGGAGN